MARLLADEFICAESPGVFSGAEGDDTAEDKCGCRVV